MFPDTTIYVSSYYYMCPHTTTYSDHMKPRDSSPQDTDALASDMRAQASDMRAQASDMQAQPATYVFSYYYMCPHTAIYSI
jgi:hypothetical protein